MPGPGHGCKKELANETEMNEKNTHNSFEKGLREAFHGFSRQPDPALWGRIDAALQRRKRIVLFARLSAAASLLLLFSIGAWFVFHQTETDTASHPLAVLEAHDTIPERISADDPDILKESVPEIRTELAEASPKRIKETISHKPEQAETPKASPGEIVAETTLADPVEEIIPSTHLELPAETEPALAEQPRPVIIESDPLYQLEDFLPEKAEEKKWQLALGYGTIQGQAVSDASESYKQQTANFGADPFSSKISRETSQFSSIENTVHAQPITLGLIINRNFSGVWGIETGILFTRLKTISTTSTVNDEYTKYGSEILYLGLPASVRLNMIRGKRLGMYISQGAVIEKGVRTRHYSRHYIFNEPLHLHSETYMADGVQISSLTAIGFEFRLSGLLSLYAQPGLQVFFLNQTQPYNIRSSSAIWPSLQTGLKFQL